MKCKNKKSKMWFEEHKDNIAHGMMKLGLNLFIFGFGYCVGIKILGNQIENDITIAHDQGLIKFFNPTTNIEIGVKDAAELIAKLGK